MLVVGTMLLARRHAVAGVERAELRADGLSPSLAWADTQYTSDLWLRTLLFLTLFVTVFLIVIRDHVTPRRLVALAVTLLLAHGARLSITSPRSS